MKKTGRLILAVMLSFTMLLLAGCSFGTSDPKAPPQEIVRSESAQTADTGTGDTDDTDTAAAGEILKEAVSIRVGRDGQTEFNVDMYNNNAAAEMLDYLSDDALLFPTYTYDDEQGFVAQSIRGSYTRDDEITVTEVSTGELYLFGDGQLRLYFKDIEGAEITATPIGFFTDAEAVSQTIEDAYQANQGDTWGVDVYFWITKTLG